MMKAKVSFTITTVALVTLTLSIVGVPAIAANGRGLHSMPQTVSAPSNAEEEAALNQFRIDHGLAPIKNKDDLRKYLASSHVQSPLSALSSSNRKLFLNSLAFGDNGGVATFNHLALQQLRPTQIYQILKLFGLQLLTPTVGSKNIQSAADKTLATANLPLVKVWGLPGFMCEIGANGKKLHTCTPEQNDTCTINC